MAPEAWLTALVTVLALGALALTRMPPDMAFAGALTVLLVAGVVGPAEAFAGFANPGVITVAVLYVVVAGLQETGAVHWLGQRVLGRPPTLLRAQARLMAPVAGLSAVLNNTPVVAMMIPTVREWGRGLGIAPSKLLIPLSYAAILGGTCTLIGTSTNLVVHGLMLQRGMPELGLFDLAWVGLPLALVGGFAILAAGRRWLPERVSAAAQPEDPREYSVSMRITPRGPMDGRTVEGAGLRNLGGLYLAEIERDGRVLPAVPPHERLYGGDQLLFVGLVDSVVELQRMPGLEPADGQPHKLEGDRGERLLVEAVVSDHSPLLGRSVRDGRFRNRYGAVVIAVARGGERLQRKIGDIVLRAGDTLLLEARPEFTEHHRNARDFYLVSPIPNSNPPRFGRATLALGILAAMVALAASGLTTLLQAALLGAAGMLITRCVTPNAARRNIDAPVLIVIASAFGIGAALETTGLAATLGHGLAGLAGSAPIANLAAVYLATALFSAAVTNNAAAVLMFPVAEGVAADVGASLLPFAIAIMIAASASFATPIGYQTNLMVYGPGGYRFHDFLRIGLPLTALTGVLAVLIIPLVWRF